MRKMKIGKWLDKYNYPSAYALAKKYRASEPSILRWAENDDYRMLDCPTPTFIHTPTIINELELR